MRRFTVSERSMAPALDPGDTFVARRLWRPRRGRVVFFPHPGRPEIWLVKRIVGLPTETVNIHDGLVYIDGVELEEPWTTDPTTPDGQWDLQPREMFVLSDARHRTLADSRTMGPIPIHPSYTPLLRYRRGAR